MPEIRPLAQEDLPVIARLLHDRIEDWPGDERFLRATLLDHPWADPGLPSLVAVDESGTVVGFVGVQARRLRFAGKDLRGVVCSHLAVAPDAGAAGALLLSRLLQGDQAITWSDSANEPVVRMWLAFGGQLDHSRACDWMLLLRPLRWIRSGVTAALRRQPVGRGLVPVAALPVHGALARSKRHAVPGPAPGISGNDATAAEVIAELPGFADKWSVAVNHDQQHLDHLFRLIARSPVALTCRLVRHNGRPLGWYAYTSQEGRAARVLHLAAVEKRAADVLAELVQHATASGATALTGRAEPHLDRALAQRLAVLGFARQPVLHTRDPELFAALATGSSLLTQLDSEWFVP